MRADVMFMSPAIDNLSAFTTSAKRQCTVSLTRNESYKGYTNVHANFTYIVILRKQNTFVNNTDVI